MGKLSNGQTQWYLLNQFHCQCHLEMSVVMTGVVRGVLNACHFTIGVVLAGVIGGAWSSVATL